MGSPTDGPTPRLSEPRRAPQSIWAPYLGLMALATAGYVVAGLTGPSWLHSGLVFNLIGGLSVAGLIAGANLHAPRRRLPWYLLAIGQALFVTSDVLAYNYERLFGEALHVPVDRRLLPPRVLPLPRRRPAAADPRTPGRPRPQRADRLADRDARARDAAVGLSDLPVRRATARMSELRRLASIGYPAMDILLVGVLARMAAGCHRREPAFSFMLCAIGALLFSDAVYGWRLLEGHFQPGPVTMAGWAVFYTLLGTAAMHPSMRRLSEPGPDTESTLTRARLALLACASLTVPAVIVVRRALGEHIDLYVLVGASAAMFALVLLRMAGIVRRHEVAHRPRGGAADRARRTEHAPPLGGAPLLADQELLRRRLRSSTRTARVRYVSDSVARTLGLAPGELTDAVLLDFVHVEDVPRLRSLISSLATQPAGQPTLIEFRVRRPEPGRDGQPSWRDVEAAGCNLLGDEAVAGIVLNMRDISERKAFQNELEHQAFHDTLTGLPEPRAVPQPRRARARRATPRPAPGGRAVPRPRRLQVRQRQPRPRGRRRGAPGGRPAARATACARSTPPPASAATSSRSCCGTPSASCTRSRWRAA